MTFANFQPTLTHNKSAIAKTAIWAQLAVSFFRFLRSTLPAKRPLDAGAVLAAQARHEAARRNVNNLLR